MFSGWEIILCSRNRLWGFSDLFFCLEGLRHHLLNPWAKATISSVSNNNYLFVQFTVNTQGGTRGEHYHTTFWIWTIVGSHHPPRGITTTGRIQKVEVLLSNHITIMPGKAKDDKKKSKSSSQKKKILKSGRRHFGIKEAHVSIHMSNVYRLPVIEHLHRCLRCKGCSKALFMWCLWGTKSLSFRGPCMSNPWG